MAGGGTQRGPGVEVGETDGVGVSWTTCLPFLWWPGVAAGEGVGV